MIKDGKYYLDDYTVYVYDSVDSTNSVAKRAISMMGSELDLSVHVAGEQTAGRGRNSRVWQNTKGAVLMSIVRSTKLSMRRMPILNLAAAMAVRNALLRLTNNKIDISIKWPNDIVTTDRMEKLCGILSEAVLLEKKRYAVIGIGLNLNATSMPGDLLQPATSVFLQYGKYINVFEAVNEIVREFKVQYKLISLDPDAFIENFSKCCLSLKRHVAVINGEQVRYGVGEKLADNGQLIVNYEDGNSEMIYAADVSIRGQVSMNDIMARKLLPKRRPGSNKGDHGKALIIAGSDPMPGAALMCTKACIRGGAGLTKALITEGIGPMFSAVPEAMIETDETKADELIEWADAVLIGCGMGVNERTFDLLAKVLASKKPCVVDADALNTLAKNRELLEHLHDKVIITPHPMEMSRLVIRRATDIVRELSHTALDFARKYGCIVLLKSASSVVATPDGQLRYNDSGNSGLAKGGSGDVLAGLIAAMLAQGAAPYDAASLGAYILGLSAEKAIDFLHNRFITATDIIDIIGSELNGKGE